jgi:hypothetical protein
MRSQVKVSWSESSTHLIDLDEVQPMPHEQARVWLDQQFTELGCDPIRLSGKVLAADKILLVAQAAGPRYFAEPQHREWAVAFARAASAALAKPVVTVDLAIMAIGY